MKMLRMKNSLLCQGQKHAWQHDIENAGYSFSKTIKSSLAKLQLELQLFAHMFLKLFSVYDMFYFIKSSEHLFLYLVSAGIY